MPESVDTIIVGAGQAGLSVSSYLATAGRDHLILERGEIAETWRSQRWESFTVNSPNWMNQLPGDDRPLDKPNDFWHRDELIESFTSHAKAKNCRYAMVRRSLVSTQDLAETPSRFRRKVARSSPKTLS